MTVRAVVMKITNMVNVEHASIASALTVHKPVLRAKRHWHHKRHDSRRMRRKRSMPEGVADARNGLKAHLKVMSTSSFAASAYVMR